jgi:hypothetical protein
VQSGCRFKFKSCYNPDEPEQPLPRPPSDKPKPGHKDETPWSHQNTPGVRATDASRSEHGAVLKWPDQYPIEARDLLLQSKESESPCLHFKAAGQAHQAKFTVRTTKRFRKQTYIQEDPQDQAKPQP